MEQKYLNAAQRIVVIFDNLTGAQPDGSENHGKTVLAIAEVLKIITELPHVQ